MSEIAGFYRGSGIDMDEGRRDWGLGTEGLGTGECGAGTKEQGTLKQLLLLNLEHEAMGGGRGRDFGKLRVVRLLIGRGSGSLDS